MPYPGDVWLVKLHWVPHNKFVICIEHDGDTGYYFFINSEKQYPEYQILITPSDLPCLSHPSYIDASEVKAINSSIIDHARATSGLGRVGQLPIHFETAIVATCNAHNLMPGRFIQIVKANLKP